MQAHERPAKRGEDAVKMQQNAVKIAAAEASRARVKGNTLSRRGEDAPKRGEDRPPQAGPGLPRLHADVTPRQRRKLANQVAHARAQVEHWRSELEGGLGGFYRTQKQRSLDIAEARLAHLEATLANVR